MLKCSMWVLNCMGIMAPLGMEGMWASTIVQGMVGLLGLVGLVFYQCGQVVEAS